MTTDRREVLATYRNSTGRPSGWKASRRSSRINFEQIISTSGVRRWDGRAQTSTPWDHLARDSELWFPDGDCYIHLYARGTSRCGPSFRVHYDKLLDAQCGAIIDRYLDIQLEESDDTESEREEAHMGHQRKIERYDLYIPPPSAKSRNEAVLFHLTTRNLLAFVYGMPIVGPCLGTSLVRLLNRMKEVRPADNVRHALQYMDAQGYLELRSQRDHALAALNFAEYFQLRDLWIAAFSHCAGMDGKLSSSPEYEYISRPTRALISRARFEMDIRLDRCGTSLKSFLEEDLLSIVAPLSSGARAHLDRFRIFLKIYYTEKLGSYPPSSDRYGAAFPKHVCELMCEEFQDLYDFLVDESIMAGNASTAPEGEFSVMLQIQDFDRKSRHETMQYPLPLLPHLDDTPQKQTFSEKFSLRNRKTKKSMAKAGRRLDAMSALTQARNSYRSELLVSPLVQAYCEFESNCIFTPTPEAERRLSVSDARKVRWILIYATLQTLRAATTVPKEVESSKDVPYNLCVLTAGCPPWKEVEEIKPKPKSRIASFRSSHVFDSPDEMLESKDPIVESIKPDIDWHSISHKSDDCLSRSNSTSSLTRSSSIISAMSRKSSLRRALSGKKSSTADLKSPKSPKSAKSHRSSFHEIVVHGYGNGTNNVLDMSTETLVDSQVSLVDGKLKQTPDHEVTALSTASDETMVEFFARWSSETDVLDRPADDEDAHSSSSDDYRSCN